MRSLFEEARHCIRDCRSDCEASWLMSVFLLTSSISSIAWVWQSSDCCLYTTVTTSSLLLDMLGNENFLWKTFAEDFILGDDRLLDVVVAVVCSMEEVEGLGECLGL